MWHLVAMPQTPHCMLLVEIDINHHMLDGQCLQAVSFKHTGYFAVENKQTGQANKTPWGLQALASWLVVCVISMARCMWQWYRFALPRAHGHLMATCHSPAG